MGDEKQKRIPTTIRIDTSNEQAILTTCVAHPEKTTSVLRRISPECFLNEQHRDLWAVYKECLTSGTWYDKATVRRAIVQRRPSDDKISSYVAAIEKAKPEFDPERLNRRIEILLYDVVRQRVVTGILPDLVDALADNTKEPARAQAAARRIVFAIGRTGNQYVVSKERVETTYASTLQKRVDRKTKVYGLSSPEIDFSEFDSLLGIGFSPGTMSLLASVTTVGKTAFLVNWARCFAKQGRRVIYFAWEENWERFLDTLCAIELGIELTRIKRGELSKAEMFKCVATVRAYTQGEKPLIQFGENPFTKEVVFGGKEGSNNDNLQVAAGMIEASGAEIVMWDLFEKLLRSNRPDQVESAIEGVRVIHEELNVHGILVGRINLKDMARTQNATPNLGQVKGASAWVEVPDNVFILDRPGATNIGMPDTWTDLICSKQRDGKSPWCVRWTWEGEYKRISLPKIIKDRSPDPYAGVDDLDVPEPLEEVDSTPRISTGMTDEMRDSFLDGGLDGY